jgi:alkylation response protein AidB-like acyl-CoA dehydrogenase
MDFSFSEEQETIRDLARQILAARATGERWKELQRGDWYDAELWRELAASNLPAIAVPEKLGGSGLGPVEAALVLEEVGRHLSQVPLFATLVLGSMPIAQFGSEAQQRKYLVPVAESAAILTGALQEYASYDAALPRTRARRDGAGYRLEGEKTCVPAAHLALAMLVPARSDDDELGIFLVEPNSAGVKLERQIATNHEPLSRVTLDGARVGSDAVLGSLERGAEILDWTLQRAQLGLAAMQLGVADAAMRQTAGYVTQRKQFGRPIGSFQSAQHRIADAYIDVECLRSVLIEAAWRMSEGLPAAHPVAAAKWWACLAGDRVTHTAQHLHGGTGADIDYPVHRHFLWSQQLLITLGGPAQTLADLGARLVREFRPEA